jgi:hypothetical protein
VGKLTEEKHSKMQFTMKTEMDWYLPFLDMYIYRRNSGSLGHKVCRKLTRTDLYLNANSDHHPSNKQALLNTTIHRTYALCVSDSLQDELAFLRTTFKDNGYNNKRIRRAFAPSTSKVKTRNKPIFQQRYCRILAAHTTDSVECWRGTTSRV